MSHKVKSWICNALRWSVYGCWFYGDSYRVSHVTQIAAIMTNDMFEGDREVGNLLKSMLLWVRVFKTITHEGNIVV